MKELVIKFGILNPPLHEQLIKQGLKCSSIDHFEKLRQSVIYLKCAVYISDSQANKMYKKIFDQLSGLVEEVQTIDQRATN